MLLVEPGLVISLVLDTRRVGRHQQGLKGIHHHRQFVGLLGSDALLYRTRMWPVGNAPGVEGNHPFFHIFTTHKVTVHVIQHLVTVDVAVVVGRGNGQGVVVEQARHEGANDEAPRGEGLVNRWGLVDPAGDRLKIVDRKGVGINVTIPTYDVEGVAEVMVGVEVVLLLDVEQKITLLIVGIQACGFADVAFAEGRVFEQLSKLIPVALGRNDGAGRLHDEQTVVRPVEVQLVNRTPGDDQVIAVGKG